MLSDDLILQSQQDENALAALVAQQERFILRTAAVTCRRFVTKQDDEWSIALEGFVQAVKSYRPERGGFCGFARVVMARRLTDYLRAQGKHAWEVSTDPAQFEEPAEDMAGDLPLRIAVMQQAKTREEDLLRLEIAAANEALSHYGFSFFDLVQCSPKAGKTRDACTRAVVFLLSDPSLFEQMRHSMQLPIKILAEAIPLPRKILERHRKYIIAAAELLSGEYPCLAEYLHHIRKELYR